MPSQHVLANAEGTHSGHKTVAGLRDCIVSWSSAAASSCFQRPMNVRDWMTYQTETRVQHNKGSIFNTCHQSTVKFNFIHSNIQFPENKKVYKATASLEWDSGLARVLYICTFRQVVGIHTVLDLLQVLLTSLLVLNDTWKSMMTANTKEHSSFLTPFLGHERIISSSQCNLL